jgi:hypothetical protein
MVGRQDGCVLAQREISRKPTRKVRLALERALFAAAATLRKRFITKFGFWRVA